MERLKSEITDSETASVSARSRGLVSVVLATYNERENICGLIRDIIECVQDPVEVMVVDDDSPDETWRCVEQLGDARVKLIRRVATRGLASAINRGVLESRGDVVGWMDADRCMPPTLLPVMIEKLEEYDVVIGSRYIRGGKDERAPLRVWTSRLINGLAGLVLGFGIKDYDSGFIVLRRTVFDKVSLTPTGYGEYFIEFLYRCRKKGLTVCEMPYVFRDRTEGVSKSAPNLYRFFRTGMQYAIRIFVAKFRKIDG